MIGFGAGWVAIDENGNWLPPRGPSLHPADAVRLVVSSIEDNGPMLAGLISEHGWIRWCPPEQREAARVAEQRARAQLVNWLRAGELPAWSERGEIDATAWRRRIDVDDPSTWWPVDAPGQGCWRVSRFELDALLQPLRAARLGTAELRPASERQLKALADEIAEELNAAAEPGRQPKQGDFVSRLIHKGKQRGLSIVRERAKAEASRLGVKAKQGRKPASPKKLPE